MDNKNWSVASTGNHQGLVCDQDGKNIAVTYDKKDAPLIAAAPEMLAALNNLVDRGLIMDIHGDHYEEVLVAIAKASNNY